MRKICVFLLLGLLMFTTACQSEPIVSVQSATPVTTLTLSPNSMPGMPAAPSVTMDPTKPRATRIPPATKIPTPTPTSTLYLTSEDLVATLTARQTPFIKIESVSPDERYRVHVLRYECLSLFEDYNEGIGYEILILTDTVQGQEQILAEQMIMCGVPGTYELGLISWSSNNRFLYFSDEAAGQPDGGGYWQRSLTGFELKTGNIFRLGLGSVSPGGRVIAYWHWNWESEESHLVLWDLEIGEVNRFPVAVIGATIVWAPNGNKIAFLSGPVWQEWTEVYLLDTQNGKVSKLQHTSGQRIIQLEWVVNESLTIHYAGDYPSMEIYDLSTGNFSRRTIRSILSPDASTDGN